MRVGQRLEGEVGQRVAVHEKKVSLPMIGSAWRGPPALPSTSGCSHEYRTRTPRSLPSPTTRGERLRKMVEVEDEIADVLTGEPPDDAPDDRLAGDGNGRLRAYAVSAAAAACRGRR